MPDNERGMEPTDGTENNPLVIGKNYLLAIGINDYVHETKLSFAVRDAEEVTKVLQTHYQFEPENCVLLPDKKATRQGILNQLKAWKTGPHKLTEDDSLLIFYAGHGYMDEDIHEDMGYWLPQNGKRGELHITNDELVKLINGMPCRHVLLVSDSCFSGALLTQTRGVVDNRLLAQPSRWAITSGGKELVLDQSPFVEEFLKVLTNNKADLLWVSTLVEGILKAFNEGETTRQVPTSGLLDKKPGGQFVFHRRPARLDINQLQADNQALRAQVAELKIQLAQARQRPAPDAGVLTRLQKELRELQNQIDDLNEEIAAAAAKVKVLEDEAKTHKTTIKAQATEVQQLKTDLADYHQAEQAVFDAFMPERRPAALDQYLALYPRGRFAGQARQLREELVGRNYTETINGVSFTMIYVEGGEFMMGDTFGEGEPRELPVHQVTLDGYYLGETVVTQGLYRAVMDQNPSKFKLSDEHPVETVSWEDAQAFIQKLNQLTGKTYCLPTEAQWEFAARERGRQVRFGNGEDILRPSEANFDASKKDKRFYSEMGEYRGNTTPVKDFAPNALGFYDMSGNVWEWCQDWYNENFYNNPAALTRNPVNQKEGICRVYRGGSWHKNPWHARAAGRSGDLGPTGRSNSLGFRLAASSL
jgi:formylglycine-generating enzyme required for sulfatase activity